MTWQETVSGLPLGEYWYRAWAVDDSFGPGWAGEPEYVNVIGVGIEEEEELPVPDAFLLGLITPNPTSSVAMIPVSLGSVEGTTLRVLDLAGRVVENLSAQLSPGTHRVQFDAASVPAGIYFVTSDPPDPVSKQSPIETAAARSSNSIFSIIILPWTRYNPTFP